MSKNIKVEEIIVPPNATYLNDFFIFIRKYAFLVDLAVVLPFLLFFIGCVISDIVIVKAILENNISISAIIKRDFGFIEVALILVLVIFFPVRIFNFFGWFLPRRRFFNKL
ncbi:MAG: hypothetical protein QME57_03795, partial [Patescibacteria group bacterium]|nr:hypothetical protein [Patescibacteria group bacterium]